MSGAQVVVLEAPEPPEHLRNVRFFKKPCSHCGELEAWNLLELSGGLCLNCAIQRRLGLLGEES